VNESATAYLDLVGLADFADAYPRELSGGMQQRVAIARALAYEPDYLLMDEPLGALDALTRDQLQLLIADLAQKFNHTVVYVTHNVSEAVYLSDEIVVLSPSPGRVRDVIRVDTPRPRQPDAPQSRLLAAHITKLITGTRSAHDEDPGTSRIMGAAEDGRQQVGRPSPSDIAHS
jgi:NitT/TauT family transport system ATP-binding protein